MTDVCAVSSCFSITRVKALANVVQSSGRVHSRILLKNVTSASVPELKFQAYQNMERSNAGSWRRMDVVLSPFRLSTCNSACVSWIPTWLRAFFPHFFPSRKLYGGSTSNFTSLARQVIHCKRWPWKFSYQANPEAAETADATWSNFPGWAIIHPITP